MCSTRQRLAATLRERRRELGLSVRGAADRAQISPSTLSRWEAGACLPMAPELVALLKMLGMQPNDIQRILVSVNAPRAAKAVRTADSLHAVPTGGDLLRAMRSRSGRSLPAVAQMLRVAPSTVSRWESSAAHPTPDRLDEYLQIVGASVEERETLLASGVGKLKSDRRPFQAGEYVADLDKIERTICLGGEFETELRLLQIQSNLWWASEDREAEALLRRAHVIYAAYLSEWVRFKEAAAQAEKALDYGDPFDDLGIEAQRILATASTFKGTVVRPHHGLCILQSCLVHVESTDRRVSVLMDMSDLSHLAGRQSEAVSYAERAMICAETKGASSLTMARGAWATATDSLSTLQERPIEPWLACTYLLREFNLLANREDKVGMRAAASALKDLATKQNLLHFNAKLAFAEKGVTKAAHV